MPPKKPSKRRASHAVGKNAKVIEIEGTRIPRYSMPRRRRFLIDVAIGKWIAKQPDALTPAQIMPRFGISRFVFDARVRVLGPIVQAGKKLEVRQLLLEMGADKRVALEREGKLGKRMF